MEEELKIGIDIDGCLADFNGAYVQLMVNLTGKDLFPPRPFEIPTWNYPEHYGYSNEEVTRSWEHIKKSKFFWEDLQPYADTYRFLQALGQRLNDDVYFITSRVGQRVKEQTEQWLMANGYHYPTVLISSQKGLCAKALKLDYYLDDKTENCQDVKEQSPLTKGFMLAQPWNQEVTGVPRIGRLEEFLQSLRAEPVEWR